MAEGVAAGPQRFAALGSALLIWATGRCQARLPDTVPFLARLPRCASRIGAWVQDTDTSCAEEAAAADSAQAGVLANSGVTAFASVTEHGEAGVFDAGAIFTDLA